MGKRKFPEGSVCKPCWELKYCPYGPLVEFFPLYPKGQEDWNHEGIEDTHQRAIDLAAESLPKSMDEIDTIYRLFNISHPEIIKDIEQYEPEDVGCKVWGHVCPVFITQSGATETKEGRTEGRYIPRQVMFKVVRRDNHVCQVCHKYVPDNEIEFDHIIPLSKGGPTTVDNLRLLCKPCNRKKSNALDEIIDV